MPSLYKSSLAHRGALDNNPQLGSSCPRGQHFKTGTHPLGGLLQRNNRGRTPVLKHEKGLLGACCLGNTGFGACTFAGELAEDRAADDQRGAHQADRCYGFA